MLDYLHFIDKEAVENFRIAFVRDTGMSLSFSDRDHTQYSTFYAQSKCEFCRIMNSHPKGLAECKKSARLAAQKAAKSSQPLIYKCWAGLTEVVVPVIVEEKHIANVYSGQVLTRKPTEKQIDRAILKASKIRLGEDLSNIYREIPIVPSWRLSVIKGMLQLVVEYMVQMSVNELLLQRVADEKEHLLSLRQFIAREFVSNLRKSETGISSKVWEHLAFLGFENFPNIMMVLGQKSETRRSGLLYARYNIALQQKVIKTLESLLCKYQPHLVHPLDNGNILLILSINFKESWVKEAEDLAYRICQQLKVETKEPCVMGISQLILRAEQLSNAFVQAENAFNELHQGAAAHGENDREYCFHDGEIESVLTDKTNQRLLARTNVCNEGLQISKNIPLLQHEDNNLNQSKAFFVETLRQALHALEEEGLLQSDATWPLLWYSDIIGAPDAEAAQNCLNKCLAEIRDRSANRDYVGFKKTVMVATGYIAANFKENLTLEMIAKHAYVTPNYLSHLFRKHTGFSCTEYVNRMRIDYVKRRLSSTNHSISAIACDSGFRSAGYMATVFKKYEQVTPQEYRDTRGGIKIDFSFLKGR